MRRFRVDLSRAILWQYEDAENIKALVAASQQAFDELVSDFYESWYDDVFNIETANEFGLHVWARILGVNLGAPQYADPDREVWGFGEANLNFGNGNFGSTQDGIISLNTEQKRLIIRLRYAQLTTRPSILAVNEALSAIFRDRGKVYVVDYLDMSQSIVMFDFEQDAEVQQVLDNYDLLPRPAAVGVRWQFVAEGSFGFGEHHLNFNNGNFSDYEPPRPEPVEEGFFGFSQLHSNFNNGAFGEPRERPPIPTDDTKFGYSENHENFGHGNFRR